MQDAHDRYQETELDAVLDRLARYEGPVLVVPPPDPTPWNERVMQSGDAAR